MRVKELKIKVPQELVDFLESAEETEREIAQSAVLEWYREGKVSSGKAAKLLGMTRRDFLDFLGKRKIPIVTVSSRKLSGMEKLLSPKG